MDISCSRLFHYAPYGSHRDIGAGIAMTVTGILAIVLWFGSVFVLLAAGIVPNTVGFVLISAAFWIPLGLLSAFPIGVLLWWFTSSRRDSPYRGAFFGGATMACSLAIGSLFPALFNPLLDAFAGEIALLEAIGQAAVRLLRSFGMALLAAGWLIIPLGAIAGWCYDQS